MHLHSAGAATLALVLITAGPTVRLAAQTAHGAEAAHVVLQIDSSTIAEFDAHGLDVDIAHLAGSAAAGPSTAEIRIVKQAGPFTGALVNLSTSGMRAPSGVIQLFDSLGVPLLTLRLSDVTVESDHISLSSARGTLLQQSISQQEALAQLTTDSHQADRDLATAEELGKSHVNTRLELSRARETAREMHQRLQLAQERQALLAKQLAGQGEIDEVVVLRFVDMTIDAVGPGGHGEWTAARPPPQRSTAAPPRDPNRTSRLRPVRPDSY